MQEKKCDRRIIKTKKAIRNAFITLLTQKDYNNISVKDIADAADVDRKTVYNYYRGIYEIREELENELIALLEEARNKIDYHKYIEDPKQLFVLLTEVIDSNLELYGNLMKLDAQSYMVRKFIRSLTELVRTELEKSPYIANADTRRLDVAAQFVTSGMLTAYQHWFNSDRKMPLDELSKTVGELVLYGLKSLQTDKQA